MFATEAPLQDLACIKALEEVCSAKGTWPEGLQTIAKTALDKLKLHTWYLSERLVVLALFSNIVDNHTSNNSQSCFGQTETAPFSNMVDSCTK